MIYLLYLAIAVCFIIFIISLWQKNANLGAVSAFGFLAIGLFIFLVSKGIIIDTIFIMEDNLISELLSILFIGLGAMILGSSMEDWFSILN